jgi:hypothetical protein
MLLQRRQAQNTAFVWAVSLDGAPVALKVSDVQDARGKNLLRAEALLVQVSVGKIQRSLLVNPQQKNVAAALPGGEAWRSEAVLSIR